MLNSLWLFREIAARNCGMEQQEKVYDVEDFVFAYRRRKD